MHWQPIETAPMDGTRFLALGSAYGELRDDGFSWGMHDTNKPMVDGFVCIIKWIERWYDDEVDLGDGTYRKEKKRGVAHWAPHAHAFRPTHWMPLPSAMLSPERGKVEA